MAQSFSLSQGNQRVIGPVSGLPAGSVLPAPVVFTVSGSSVALVPVDAVTVKAQAVAGQSGDSVITVSSGSLSDTVTLTVAAAASTSLAIPVSDEQVIG